MYVQHFIVMLSSLCAPFSHVVPIPQPMWWWFRLTFSRNPFWWMGTMLMAGGLELYNRPGPFQLKSFCDEDIFNKKILVFARRINQHKNSNLPTAVFRRSYVYLVWIIFTCSESPEEEDVFYPLPLFLLHDW